MEAIARAAEILSGNAGDAESSEYIELAQELGENSEAYGTVRALLDAAENNRSLLSDPRLAELMVRRYSGAFGEEPDELQSKLWAAFGAQDYEKVDDLREELEDSGKHLEHLFWTDASALLGSSLAARMVPLYAADIFGTAMEGGFYDVAYYAADKSVYWLEKIENGLEGYAYPWGSLPQDEELAPRYLQLQADSWATLGRSSFVKCVQSGANVQSSSAKFALTVAFEKGSFAAGFYLAYMLPQTDEEWAEGAEIANAMLDYDLNACLSEIDALPENDKGEFSCELLNLAAKGLCYGIGNLPVSYDKAYSYYEISAQRGSETAKEKLGHFRKKMFGGLVFRG